jgi:HPt (histidine-containing phosphotransfer) domain-containing protein
MKSFATVVASEMTIMPPARPHTYNDFDLAAVRDVIGERPDVLLELVMLANKVGGEQMAEVNASAAARDLARLRFAAHNLRNTLTFLHATKAMAVAERVESLATHHEYVIPSELLMQLNVAFEDVLADLSYFFQFES